ncbi:serine hydrolase domain-containing protein [Microtetraspora malaysiensis]|uniref:serine hydrolase domain-containing protein n=1 Tax=Microtetraspora malaysiensis TaxID=161358 RepID=UPI003D9073B9
MTTASELLASLTETTEKHRLDIGVPGVALGVAAGGEVASTGLGVTSVADPLPVTTNTLFRLCSITKIFAATLAMTLVEEGVLDLDVPVVAYYPELSLADADARASVTMRHLLTHASGLESELRGDLETFGRNADALDRVVSAYGSLRQFAPAGEIWGYCNTGYWLAGAVLARLAGTSFEDAVSRRVLEPLGMTGSCFLAEDAVLGRVALPHRRASAGSPEHVPIPSFAFPRARVPSGGVIAGVNDLLKFAGLHLGNGPAVISEAGRAMMREPLIPGDSAGDHQGLGWMTSSPGGTPVVEHSGSYKGYCTRLTLLPDLGVAVAVLTNSDDGGRLCRAVKEAALELLTGWRTAEVEYADLGPDVLAAYAGDYAIPGVDRIRVSPHEGGLRLELVKNAAPAGESLCRATSETEFEIVHGPSLGSRLVFFPGSPVIRLGLRLGARLS